MKSLNQIRLGIILQYSQMGLSILIQLLYTPVMLRILGSTEYGIYSLAQSTISYLTLLSLGFGSSYLRWYSLYKKDEDYDGIKKLNGLYLSVFIIMGIIALFAGSFLTANVQWFFNETYTNSEIELARILMVFLTVNLAISFPSSIFVSYVTSQENFVFQKLLNMGTTILSPAVNIILLYHGFGSVGMVLTSTCISIIVMCINIYYCFNRLDMRITFHQLDWSLLYDIFKFSIFIAINEIVNQINWQTDKVILGKVVNGTAVAVYTIGAQINTYFTQFSTAISSVFSPKVNMIISRNKSDMDEELTSLFIKVGRIQWYVLSLILTGFIFFGQYFIQKWAGKEYGNSYYVAILLMAPAIIPLIQNIGIEIQRGKNKHQFRSIVYLVMAIINVFISYIFASQWGEVGAALGTTISLLVANGLIMNIYYQKALGINVIKFWQSIGTTLLGFIAPMLFGIYIINIHSFTSFQDFILMIFIYTSIYIISIYFLSLNSNEKNGLSEMVSKVLNK